MQDHLFTKSIVGTIFNPLTKSWSWINNTSVSYTLYAQKLVHE
jgi:2-polyprenyl-3-methyl-5-hydroxy-6-metoxy-1,4-benzoquinol methylase